VNKEQIEQTIAAMKVVAEMKENHVKGTENILKVQTNPPIRKDDNK